LKNSQMPQNQNRVQLAEDPIMTKSNIRSVNIVDLLYVAFNLFTMYLLVLGYKMYQNGESDIGLTVWFSFAFPLFTISSMSLASRVNSLQYKNEMSNNRMRKRSKPQRSHQIA
jgi:hypothetical protein